MALAGAAIMFAGFPALGVDVVLPQSAVEIGADEEPVPIGILGAAGVQGVDLVIAYDPTVVRLGVEPQRTVMSAHCMLGVNAAVAGQMKVALACPEPIQGSGALLTLALRGTGAGTSRLALEHCDVNEGAVACAPRDGSVTVSGGASALPALAQFLRLRTDTSTAADRLTFRGGFLLPADTTFAALDPQSHGAQVLIAAGTGAVRVSIELPPGSYGGPGSRGWSRRSGGWVYLDRTDAPIDGITRMFVWDGVRRMPGLVLVRVKGKGGSYPVADSDLPLRVAIDLGGRTSARPEQVESNFAASSCSATGDGAQHQCRQ